MSPEISLACTLRYLAGGQVYDISDRFGLERSTVYYRIQLVLDALRRPELCEAIGKVEFQNEREWLSLQARRFQGLRISNPLSSGCVGALDGLAIKIVTPPVSFNPQAYSNRKGYSSLCCQAICDAQMRFSLFSCNTPGSSHDSTAFSKTLLWDEIVANKGLVVNFLFFVGGCVCGA